jgi:hypothetical protein
VHDVLIAVWALALLLRNRYDFVHAHEESVFFARPLKPLFQFQLIYDMHSSLPQQLENFQYTSSKLLIRLFERLEMASIAGADAVITICPELAQIAVERMPDPTRHFLIENSVLDEVRLKQRSQSVPENGAAEPDVPGDRPLILYAGSFEPYQGLDLLLAAFLPGDDGGLAGPGTAAERCGGGARPGGTLRRHRASTAASGPAVRPTGEDPGFTPGPGLQYTTQGLRAAGERHSAGGHSHPLAYPGPD